jgi:hypothetical protein
MSRRFNGPPAVRASSARAALAWPVAGPTSANRTGRRLPSQPVGRHTQLKISSRGSPTASASRAATTASAPVPMSGGSLSRHAVWPDRIQRISAGRPFLTGVASAQSGQPWLASTCPVRFRTTRRKRPAFTPCTAGCAGGRPAAPAIRSCCICTSRSAAVGFAANSMFAVPRRGVMSATNNQSDGSIAGNAGPASAKLPQDRQARRRRPSVVSKSRTASQHGHLSVSGRRCVGQTMKPPKVQVARKWISPRTATSSRIQSGHHPGWSTGHRREAGRRSPATVPAGRPAAASRTASTQGFASRSSSGMASAVIAPTIQSTNSHDDSR